MKNQPLKKKKMSKSIDEIAKVIGGIVQCSSEQQKNISIDSLAISPNVSTDKDLVFVYDQKYFKNLSSLKAKAFIFPAQLKEKLPALGIPVIWVERPRLVLKKLLELFGKKKYFPIKGVHESAKVDPSCKISKDCSIGANVFIGPNTLIGEGTIICANVFVASNVEIGKNCIIYPNCIVLDSSRIGNNVILHPGVVIGSDGYSYVSEEESNLEKAKKGNFDFNLGRQIQHKIPCIGNVVIEDDVEIGANTCVDCGTIGSTIVGAGTKIDNLVQVAHNCKIGKDCLIVGQVGFAGSVNVGDRVVVGGQVGFADNINIGNDVIFLAKSGVHGEIPSNSVYMGVPAVPYQDYFKNERAMKRLPRKYEKLEEQVKLLEAKINQLEKKLSVKV